MPPIEPLALANAVSGFAVVFARLHVLAFTA